MPMPPHMFDPVIFGIEFIYTSIILILCFLIFFKTRDLYNLTRHKGIGYFRSAFLFFAIAYLIRFLMHIFMFWTMSLGLFVPHWIVQPILLVFTGYFSTMAIFYLIYSILWRKIATSHFLIFSNSVAVLLSLTAFLTHSRELLVLLQVVLLIGAVMLSFMKKDVKKKSFQVRVLYLLILIFWAFNLFLTGPIRLIPPEIIASVQALSLIVFFLIYHKASKWIQ